MRFPSHKSALTVLTIAVLILSLYVHRHKQGRTGYVDNLMIDFTGGVQKYFYFFGSGIRAIFEKYVLLVDIKERYLESEKENSLLQAKLTQLKELELENARLRDALSFRDRTELPLIPAHIVAQDVSTEFLGVRIDKGQLDGVKIGHGVVSPQGVVGRVLRVSKSYSDVVTLVDPTSNIDVMVQRSRSRGVLSGIAKQSLCKVKYIDKLDDIQIEDTLVSTGFGNIFPKGLLVGVVMSVTPSRSGVLKMVTARTAIDLFRLEEVFIVLSESGPKTAIE